MKQLQSDCTTPEQSKLLLKLGLPKWTANMRYENDLIEEIHNRVFYSSPTYGAPREYFSSDFPCWSIGRLLDIINICNCTDFPIECEMWRGGARITEYMIKLIERLLKTKCIDFSKLEDKI